MLSIRVPRWCIRRSRRILYKLWKTQGIGSGRSRTIYKIDPPTVFLSMQNFIGKIWYHFLITSIESEAAPMLLRIEFAGLHPVCENSCPRNWKCEVISELFVETCASRRSRDCDAGTIPWGDWNGAFGLIWNSDYNTGCRKCWIPNNDPLANGNVQRV